MTKKYSSKVSYGLLTVVFVVFFSPLILNLIKSGINLNLTLISLFLIIIFGLITHMFLKTEYTIEAKKLKTLNEKTVNVAWNKQRCNSKKPSYYNLIDLLNHYSK